MVDQYIIRDSIDHYGKEIQAVVCMEECAELIQAISKKLRGEESNENLAEEIADVTICLDMLRQIFGVPEVVVWNRIKEKQLRNLKRIKEDELKKRKSEDAR